MDMKTLIYEMLNKALERTALSEGGSSGGGGGAVGTGHAHQVTETEHGRPAVTLDVGRHDVQPIYNLPEIDQAA